MKERQGTPIELESEQQQKISCGSKLVPMKKKKVVFERDRRLHKARQSTAPAANPILTQVLKQI